MAGTTYVINYNMYHMTFQLAVLAAAEESSFRWSRLLGEDWFWLRRMLLISLPITEPF